MFSGRSGASSSYLGAIVEVVQECRSAPTHVPAILNTPGTAAECQSGPTLGLLHPYPCRNER